MLSARPINATRQDATKAAAESRSHMYRRIGHFVEIQVAGDRLESKSDYKLSRRRGGNSVLFASLTTKNIHLLRPHEPRRAEHAYQGARRAPWTPPARQNTGNGHSCKGLHARPAFLAADTAPGGHRLTGDISNTRASWAAALL